MNEICIVLYVNALYSQHLLNKPLTNRESNKLMLFPSQLFFSIVENLLRVYAVYYQYGYIIIHQFNKKRIVLQGFKLFPCDGVETTDSFYRLISALPIVIELVSGICKPVRGRSKFPTFLQYLSDLVLLHLYLRMYQQKKNVVVAERECVRADTFHNVKDKFAHKILDNVGADKSATFMLATAPVEMEGLKLYKILTSNPITRHDRKYVRKKDKAQMEI